MSQSESTTDPRLSNHGDKTIVEAMRLIGLDKTAQASITKEAPVEEKLASFEGAEKVFQSLMGITGGSGSNCVPDGLNSEVVLIKGVDGNDIKLFIDAPSCDISEPRPCVLHCHGGGMCILTAEAENYVKFRRQIAQQGVIVVGVDFRNAAGINGPYRFPAGLNDCMSALNWVHKQRHTRNITKIITCGDSGGGNLACAVVLKAKKDNLLHQIDGVYAFCPYIYGLYGDDIPEREKLPSLTLNDGIFMNMVGAGGMASLYLPEGQSPQEHPLAWPYWASAADVTGLPPHVISVNELDPLRDEGIAYYRKLNAAGVQVRCLCLYGTPHASESAVFLKAGHYLTKPAVADVANFAFSL